jgi:ElaB/YqjD/DUF883 family membrane-anchored ribosome-binding protein
VTARRDQAPQSQRRLSFKKRKEEDMNANEMATGLQTDPVTTDKLLADIRMLAADLEQLLKATASQTGERVAQVRAKAEESLHAARIRVAELQQVAMAKTRVAGRATDAYVHANPWQALAIGAFAGLVLGLMLGRSSDAE